jgi:hypothetical protein
MVCGWGLAQGGVGGIGYRPAVRSKGEGSGESSIEEGRKKEKEEGNVQKGVAQ